MRSVEGEGIVLSILLVAGVVSRAISVPVSR